MDTQENFSGKEIKGIQNKPGGWYWKWRSARQAGAEGSTSHVGNCRTLWLPS
jgi:hypothetical protein